MSAAVHGDEQRRATSGPHGCRLCGGPTADAFVTFDRNRKISQDRFRFVDCTRCGTLSLVDVPVDLGRYYPADYYGAPRSADAVLARDPNAQHRLELVRRLAPRGRLLEVGPSMGAFLERARRSGYDVSGIEFDATCCAFIMDVLGIPVLNSDNPASALAGPYDAIVMWHVIEHLAEPREFLRAAASALAPGGVLVLTAPNPRSLQGRLLRGRWAHVDAPRHLSLMPLDALIRAGEDVGLQLAHASTADEEARRCNAFGWAQSLTAGTSGTQSRRAMWLVGAGLRVALAPIERRGDLGASYTLALRRPTQ